MKTLTLTVLLLWIALVGFGQTKNADAIRKIIEAQVKNFHTNQKAALTFWHFQPETRWVSSNLDGSVLFLTGDDFKKAIAGNSLPPADSATATLSNFVVKANDKVGWATFDDDTVYPDGKIVYLHQFRLLEKVGDNWKIISGGAHQYKRQ